VTTINRVRNSWWFFRDVFGSKNRAIYGNIYSLPREIGRFDTTIAGAILLHLSNPFAALREIASVTDEMIIVTDLENPEFGERPYIEFSPHPASSDPMCWWYLSAGAVGRMLTALGFSRLTVTRHRHRHYPTLKRDDRSVVLPFFTVVGRRNA
jgi:hypothetical protein